MDISPVRGTADIDLSNPMTGIIRKDTKNRHFCSDFRRTYRQTDIWSSTGSIKLIVVVPVFSEYQV